MEENKGLSERLTDQCADAGSLPALADDWSKIGDAAASAALKAFQKRAPDVVRKAADDLYETIMYAAQDYLVENTTYNIASRIASAERGAQEARARAFKAEQDAAALRDHLKAALRHYDMNTCIHENTKRGGTIWTICEDCGRKWADDEGGFVPYADPPEIARARNAVSLPAPVQEG